MDTRIASQFNTPTGKTRALLQFNKLSKELIAVLVWIDPETLNQEFFTYHEVMFDFAKDVVVGNADKFEIEDISTQPIEITEESVDLMAAEKITERYTVVKQINILGAAITALAQKVGLSATESEAIDSLEEMLDYIKEIRNSNEQRKCLYRESPEYKFISREEANEIRDRQLEGGLHEALGGRVIEGGSVF